MAIDHNKYNMKTLKFSPYDIPDNGKFDEFVIKYKKVGSKWVLSKFEHSVVSDAYYAKSMAHGRAAKERIETAYTSYGHIGVRVTSISPAKTAKTVYEYWPVPDHRGPSVKKKYVG